MGRIDDPNSRVRAMGRGRIGGASVEASIPEGEKLVILRCVQLRVGEKPPRNWEGKMSKLIPNWRSTRLPILPKDSPIQMPKQAEPWAELIETGMGIEFTPIRTAE